MATTVKSRDLTAKGGTTGKSSTAASSRAKSSTAAKPGTGPAGGAAQPKATRPRGFFFGMMVLFLGMEVIQIGLAYIDTQTAHKVNGKLVGGLESPALFQLPIIGNVTPMLLIFVALAVLLYWALIRFKILPTSRQLAEQRMATTTAKTSGTARTGGATAPIAPAGGMLGGIFGGLFGTKAKSDDVSSSAKSTPATKATGSKTSTGTRTTSTANGKTAGTAGKATTATKAPIVVKGKTKPAAEPATAGDESDDIYDQVKAQLRAQARKRRKH